MVMKPVLFNCIQMYKLEALNPIHGFNSQIKHDLVALMTIAEQHHESMNPFKLDKCHQALIAYDRIFDREGGNIEYLEGKVNEIIGEKNAKRIGHILKAGQTLKGFRNKIRRQDKQ